eukprot:14045733-Alexandrium_andersonii.AAC.1
MQCLLEHVQQAEALARCPLCNRAVGGTVPPPTCPCELRRAGECRACGSPCEHGVWTRVRSCAQCG